MRKLKLQVQISIDGFIADAYGNTDWLVWNWGAEWNWDTELQRYFNELKSSVDCVLLSRKMATEGFIEHWARVAEKVNDPQAEFAKYISAARKVVFTKTLTKSEWKNSEIARGNLIDEVNKLKSQSGKDIIVYGGAGFASSLIKAGLIDEYYLFVNPTVLGKGMPIFHTVTNELKLEAEESKTYACGVTVVKFIKPQD